MRNVLKHLAPSESAEQCLHPVANGESTVQVFVNFRMRIMARQNRIALHDGVDFAVRAFHQSNAGLLEPLDGRKQIIPAINPDRAFTRKCGDEGLPHICARCLSAPEPSILRAWSPTTASPRVFTALVPEHERFAVMLDVAIILPRFLFRAQSF